MVRIGKSLLSAGVAVALLAADPSAAADVAAFPAIGAGPAIVAHRGGALLWPENSLYALRQAERLGVEYLEFDLQLTADDQLLVTHDADINPQFCTADAGSGLAPKPVRELTLAQSRSFDCGARSRPSYPDARKLAGTRMPALEEVFATFADNRRIRYFIETKLPKEDAPGAPIDPARYAAALDRLLRKYALEDRVVLQSLDWRTIRAMRGLDPAVRTCPLGVAKNSGDFHAAVRELGASCVVLGAPETTPVQVRRFQQDGVLVFSGVVDAEADWRQAVEFGYDAIFTNDPVGLAAFLKKRGLRR